MQWPSTASSWIQCNTHFLKRFAYCRRTFVIFLSNWVRTHPLFDGQISKKCHLLPYNMRDLKIRYLLHWWTIVHLKNKKMTYKFCNMLWRKTPLVRSSKVSWAGASGNARSCKKYWVNSCLAKFVFYNKRVFLHTGSNCLKIYIYETEHLNFLNWKSHQLLLFLLK